MLFLLLVVVAVVVVGEAFGAVLEVTVVSLPLLSMLGVTGDADDSTMFLALLLVVIERGNSLLPPVKEPGEDALLDPLLLLFVEAEVFFAKVVEDDDLLAPVLFFTVKKLNRFCCLLVLPLLVAAVPWLFLGGMVRYSFQFVFWCLFCRVLRKQWAVLMLSSSSYYRVRPVIMKMERRNEAPFLAK